MMLCFFIYFVGTERCCVQGEAMVQIGAIARAKTNLARLQAICPKGCVQLSSLSAAITRGPAVASAKPPPSPKSN